MTHLIEAKGLTKRYGRRTVVRDVDLVVDKGEIVALIGPNGAGKTTTIEMMLGVRQPDGGTVTCSLTDARKGTGAQLQNTPFFPGLNTLDNLALFASFYGLAGDKGVLEEMLGRFSLLDVATTQASKLSGGQQRRLAIAIALVHAPQLIFLDEPTSALDPRAQRDVRELIKSLADARATVLFTSHDMTEVRNLAHRIVFIDGGSVRAEGTPEALLDRYDVPTLDELYLLLTEAD